MSDLTRRSVLAVPIAAASPVPALQDTPPAWVPGTVHVGVRYRNGRLLDAGKVYTPADYAAKTGKMYQGGAIIDWHLVGWNGPIR